MTRGTEAPALEAPAEAPRVAQYLVELRAMVAALADQVEQMEADQARYAAELEQCEATMREANLGDDEEALAKVYVRAELLKKKLAQFRGDLPPLRQKLETIGQELSTEDGKIAIAQRFFDQLAASGPDASTLIGVEVRALPMLVMRHRAALARAGIVAPPITMTF
jgi:chromosome segregation ATPase